jgi:SWI/SNF-related matrix-associated actin-dependent regulator of chromatin subfamily A-like protein 1
LDHFGRILLGDEMGVGKTIQAIAICYLYRQDWPVLIIVPSSLKCVWQDEIFRWLDFIPKSAVQIIHSLNDKIDYKASFTIVSYTLACKMGELIRRMKFQIVIADEAHYLKSRDSQRSKMLVPILR